MTLSQRLTRAGLTFLLLGSVAAVMPQQIDTATADDQTCTNGNHYRLTDNPTGTTDHVPASVVSGSSQSFYVYQSLDGSNKSYKPFTPLSFSPSTNFPGNSSGNQFTGTASNTGSTDATGTLQAAFPGGTLSVSFTIPGNAPQNVMATPSKTVKQATIAYSSVTGATGYRINRGTASGSISDSMNTTSTSFDYPASAGNTKYYYTVQAKIGNSTTYGSASAEVSADTIPTRTQQPSTTSSAKTPGTINVSWQNSAQDGSAEAVTYDLQRSDAGAAYKTIAPGLTSPSYSDTGLTSGTAYQYVVIAKNSVGFDASGSTPSNSRNAP